MIKTVLVLDEITVSREKDKQLVILCKRGMGDSCGDIVTNSEGRVTSKEGSIFARS